MKGEFKVTAMPDENPKTAIQTNLQANLQELAQLLGDPIDLQIGTYGRDLSLGVAYFESLVDRIDLKTNLLHPLIPLLEKHLHSFEQIAPLLPETGLHHCADLETAAADLLQGRAVLFLDKDLSCTVNPNKLPYPKTPIQPGQRFPGFGV